MASLVNSTKHIKKLIPIIYKVFQNTEGESLPNSFQKGCITLILKLDKDITRKEDYRPISYEYGCKNPQQNTSKPNSATHRKDYTP